MKHDFSLYIPEVAIRCGIYDRALLSAAVTAPAGPPVIAPAATLPSVPNRPPEPPCMRERHVRVG